MLSSTDHVSHTKLNQQNNSLFLSFGFPPDIVDKNHLSPNGKLLSEHQINSIIETLNEEKEEIKEGKKFSKKKFKNCKFSIIITSQENKEKKYYAIYKGLKTKKHLGAGTFGTVKLVQDLKTGEWLVAKFINKEEEIKVAEPFSFIKNNMKRTETIEESCLTSDFIPDATNTTNGLNSIFSSITKTTQGEKQILALINEYKGYFTAHSASKNCEQEILLMSLGKGPTLQHFLKKMSSEKKLSSQEAVIIINRIFTQFYEVYKKGILHRDIKPANILIDPLTLSITFIDFGEAFQALSNVDEKGNYHPEYALNPAGTIEYMHPSILATLMKVAIASDSKEVADEIVNSTATITAKLIEKDEDFTVAFTEGLFYFTEEELQLAHRELIIKSGKKSIDQAMTICKVLFDKKANEASYLLAQAIHTAITNNGALKIISNNILENYLLVKLIELKPDIEVKRIIIDKLNHQQKNKLDIGLVNFNDSTEIWSLGKVVEEIIAATNGNTNELNEFAKQCFELDPDKKLSIEEALCMLKKLNNKLVTPKNKHFGIVEYQDIENILKMKGAITALKNSYGTILLVIPKNVNFLKILEIKEKMKENGINCFDKFIINIDNKDFSKIKNKKLLIEYLETHNPKEIKFSFAHYHNICNVDEVENGKKLLRRSTKYSALLYTLKRENSSGSASSSNSPNYSPTTRDKRKSTLIPLPKSNPL